MKKGYLAGSLSLVLILFSGCAASEPGRIVLQEEQFSGINSEALPESVEESIPIPSAEDEKTDLADSSVEDTLSGMEDGFVVTEEILEQCRAQFNRMARFEGAPSQEEMDVLCQRFLDSGVMEREEMCLTGMIAGDYDGNGDTDMVVCLYSLEEYANAYSDGCLYLFMNEDAPYRIYEEFCCYGFGNINDVFGADVDGDGKTEVIISIQGTGNGGAGDTCKTIVKYLDPGIQQMELPSNLEGDYDRGIEVTVKADPEKGVYTAYCAEFDEEIEFSARREVDGQRDQTGGNCRGYSVLKMGKYQGEEVLLGYEYLFVGAIVEGVGDAVFVIKWDEEGNPYVSDWYVEGDL